MKTGGRPVELDAATAIRGRWRSIIQATLQREAWLVELLPYGCTDFAQLPESFRQLADRTLEELLTEACDLDSRQVRPAAVIDREISRRLRELVKHARAAQPRQHHTGSLPL